jgi:hypothetical protein
MPLGRIDLAYLCYAWVALVVWFERFLGVLPISPDYTQFIFMVAWVPVALSILGAALAALILTVLEWREWPLIVMMGVLVLMTFAYISVEIPELGPDEVAQGWYVVGTAVLVGLCLRWFWIRRRREQECQHDRTGMAWLDDTGER